MGNQLAQIARGPTLDYHLHDLPNISLDANSKELGVSRFLKTLKCFNDEGPILLKVYVKYPGQGDAERLQVEETKAKLEKIRDCFKSFQNENVHPFQDFVHTDKAGYMIRQYFRNNLYDRISTRPFLCDTEKWWMTYQLIYAVERCHNKGIWHGDIKCENAMITSWDWLFLSDFAPHKPVFIPVENNGEFDYFFSGKTRKCYLAPERFYEGKTIPDSSDSDKILMDIFALGCSLAELWLESPLFTYSELLRYRMDEKHSVGEKLEKLMGINPELHQLISQMIVKDPTQRLNKLEPCLRSNMFPPYFKFLHGYTFKLMSRPPDQIIRCLRQDLNMLAEKFHSEDETTPTKTADLGDLVDLALQDHLDQEFKQATQQYRPRSGTQAILLETDQLAQKISYFSEPQKSDTDIDELLQKYHFHNLGFDQDLVAAHPTPLKSAGMESNKRATKWLGAWSVEDVCSRWLVPAGFGEFCELFRTQNVSGKVLLNIVTLDDLSNTLQISGHPRRTNLLNALKELKNPTVSSLDPPTADKTIPGYILVLNMILATMRSPRHVGSVLLALECCDLIAPYLDPTVLLQRIVPHIVDLIRNNPDHNAVTTSNAIKTLTRVLARVKKLPLSDVEIFPEYILPTLSRFVNEGSELVRSTLAQCLPMLAETARSFLETSHYFTEKKNKAKKAKDKQPVDFKVEIDGLRNAFKEMVENILGIASPRSVKIALLSDIATLCRFFGQEKTNEVVLPLVISCLNIRDPELHAVWFQNIIHVSTLVGSSSVESFILPCIIPELYGDDEFTVHNALNSLSSLCDLQLFKSKNHLLSIVTKIVPLLLHPNAWIRFATVKLVMTIRSQLTEVDFHCFLLPAIRPFLVREEIDIANQKNFLQSLRKHVSRRSLEKALELQYDTKKTDNATKTGITSDGTIAAELGLLPSEISPLGQRQGDYFSLEKMRVKNISFALKISELDVPHEDEYPLFLLKKYIEVASRNRTKANKDLTYRKDELSTLTLQENTDKKLLEEPYDIKYELGYPAPKDNELASPAQYRQEPNVPFLNSSIARSQELPIIKPELEDTSEVSGSRQLRRSTSASGRRGFDSKMKNPFASLLPRPPPQLGDLFKRPTGPKGEPIPSPNWKPDNLILMGHFHEHTAAITSLVAAEDNFFFASSSLDGSVKIWDCKLLEGVNITTQSVLTWKPPSGGKINQITMCHNSHSIAAATSNGTVNVFRVDATPNERKAGSFDCSGTTEVQTLNPQEGPVVSVQHCDFSNQSLVVYATEEGYFHAWDLRSKREAWTMKNKTRVGITRAFAMEPSQYWLVAGTNLGYLCGWDLRFLLPFREWQLEDKPPIHQVLVNRSSKLGNNHSIFCVSGPGDFHLWDLKKGKCTALFRTVVPTQKAVEQPLPNFDPLQLDQLDYGIQSVAIPLSDTPVRAILCPSGSDYIVAGGTDRKLHYWDLVKPESSFQIPNNLWGQDYTSKFHSYSKGGLLVYENKQIQRNLTPEELNYLKDSQVSLPKSYHCNTISALAHLDSPQKILLSGSRDGVIKVWK